MATFEYAVVEVEFETAKGRGSGVRRPRRLNESDIPNWKTRTEHEFLSSLGKEGWHVVAADAARIYLERFVG